MLSPRESYPVNVNTTWLFSYRGYTVLNKTKNLNRSGGYLFELAYHTYRRNGHSMLFKAGKQGPFQRVDP